MKKLFLLFTCSLALALQAQPEPAPELPQKAETLASETQEGSAPTKKSANLTECPAGEPAAKPTESAVPKKEFRKLSSQELVAQYATSALFGALTGTGCHFVEKHNLADLRGPWSWILEYALRAGVMRTVEEDMQNNRDVALAPGAMKIAWASSWIAYLTAKCVAA